jgi:D-sedoheptulose 7-phosphate isomerase
MAPDVLSQTVAEAFARRAAPVARLADSAEAVAAACRDLARAFRQGGRLLVFGLGTSATDAQHVSVEFVHPVIVGKRALPAFSLVADSATVTGLAQALGADAVFEHQLGVLGREPDIALAISRDGSCPGIVRGLAAARAQGLLTVALVGGDGGEVARHDLADHCLVVASDDPRIVKEGHVTLYHLLWELTHAFLDQPAALGTDADSAAEDDGDTDASAPADDEAADTDPDMAGLYPFLYAPATGPSGLLAEVAASTRSKIAEIVGLRRSVGEAQNAALAECARAIADVFARGGTLHAFGNGGSSSDAQDIVHTFLDPGGAATPLPALCLTNDTAVVTALSNDVGFDVVFARQLQAVARPGDVAVAVSTSGGSANVLAALAEARKGGLVTVGFSGYGGGRMAEPGCVDHLFAVPSASVHRVQEVQTTLYHVLWEAVQEQLSLSPDGPGPQRRQPGRG